MTTRARAAMQLQPLPGFEGEVDAIAVERARRQRERKEHERMLSAERSRRYRDRQRGKRP